MTNQQLNNTHEPNGHNRSQTAPLNRGLFATVPKDLARRLFQWVFTQRASLFFWVISLGLFASPFLFFMGSQPPPPASFTVSNTPTPSSQKRGIEVHVSGALYSPGIYTVAIGTKGHELLTTLDVFPNADTSHLNLAKPLKDGQKIIIKEPRVRSFKRVNINLASHRQLETLPGIGQTSAKKIVLYRDTHGVIKTPDELAGIIGRQRLKAIKDRIDF